jgi:hypothetical protein
LFSDSFIHIEKIINQSICSAGIEVSEIIGMQDRLPMSAMVTDDAYVSASAKKFHEWDESFLMFAHSVRYLDDGFHFCVLVRGIQQTADVDVVET